MNGRQACSPSLLTSLAISQENKHESDKDEELWSSFSAQRFQKFVSPNFISASLMDFCFIFSYFSQSNIPLNFLKSVDS